MLMGVAKEYGAQHHGQCSESGDAGRDVGFFVEGKTQFDEMQHAVTVPYSESSISRKKASLMEAMRICEFPLG